MMDKKKLMQIVFAVIIALVFISSYVSLVNYNSQQPTTTTAGQTYYAQGFAKANLTGYGGPMYFVITSGSSASNATASNIINSNLTVLEGNNSVSNFYASGMNFSVEPGNMSAYQVYLFIFGKLNAKAANMSSSNTLATNAIAPNPYNTTAYAAASLELPQIVNFTIGAQSAMLQIPPQYRNQTIQLPMTYEIGSSIKVKLSTLIETNGTITGQMGVIVV